MATTTKKTTTTKAKAVKEELVAEVKAVEEPKVEPVPVVQEVVKEPRRFDQHDPILCRSVTAGWLGVPGKSGQLYTFTNAGDYAEIEYQDLFALKNSHSPYIYDPLLIIEDEELLQNSRWADVAKLYSDKVFTMDDVREVINLPNKNFVDIIGKLPKGLAKTLQVEVAKRIEEGTFDSINKIKAMDETFGTDFMSMLSN